MPQYHARNKTTGETITFEWPTKPTNDVIRSIFADRELGKSMLPKFERPKFELPDIPDPEQVKQYIGFNPPKQGFRSVTETPEEYYKKMESRPDRQMFSVDLEPLAKKAYEKFGYAGSIPVRIAEFGKDILADPLTPAIGWVAIAKKAIKSKPPVIKKSPLLEQPKLPGFESATPQEKITQALQEIKPLQKYQAAVLKSERAEKFGKLAEVTKGGEAGLGKRLATLKGEHAKVQIPAIRTKIESSDVESLFNQIWNSNRISNIEKTRAGITLRNILDGGNVPQTNEIELMHRVFGPEFGKALEAHLPLVDVVRGKIYEATNIPRALMASFDLSAPLRQGLPLAARKEYYKAFPAMFKSLGSEKGFKATMDAIESHPAFLLSRDAKLALTDLTNMSVREEAFISSWAERIPLIGRGVRASNRAYVGFLDKLRMDTFGSLIKDAEALGHNPQFIARDIAKFINTTTGRGEGLEGAANFLNSVFFAPRLIKSRLDMLNPVFYVKLDPFVRKQALKSLLTIASAGGTIGGLAKGAGAKVELDPRSSDFGKIRLGDTRLDLYGGFQQYVVAAAKLISNQQTSPVSGRTRVLGENAVTPTRLDVLARFGETKLNPVLSFATTFLRGKNFAGQPIDVKDEVSSRFIPIIMQDVWDLVQDDPKLLPLAVPAAFGAGLQTFGETTGSRRIRPTRQRLPIR